MARIITSTSAAPVATTQAAARTTPWKVDVSKGTHNTRVSSQWAMRPDDQKFLDLDTMYAHVKGIADESFADVISVTDIKVRSKTDDPNDLRLVLPVRIKDDIECNPTHWSFGQMCSLVNVPAAYLRRLPGQLAGINMQYGLSSFRQEAIKGYVRQNGATELRAATGPDYGRVHDHEIVAAVQRIAGSGTGSDTCWKVPGMMDWGTLKYDPTHPISKNTTTLFASDRDVFMFFVDDTHPIEIGKLSDGEPDLIFRGFMVWNSEVGSKSLGVATFYLRAVCCNRIMWGVEGYEELTLRHSKNAPMRFDAEVRPALESYTQASTTKLLTGIKQAKAAVVARTDDEREDFLGRQGFTKPQTKAIIASVLGEEHKEPESIWDFVQGITAVARGIAHTDDRVDMEKRAGRLLNKVASAK